MKNQSNSSPTSTVAGNTNQQVTTKSNWPLYLIVVMTLTIGAISYQFLTLVQSLTAGLLFICIAFGQPLWCPRIGRIGIVCVCHRYPVGTNTGDIFRASNRQHFGYYSVAWCLAPPLIIRESIHGLRAY